MSICISHKEDTDGICSATLIKGAFDVSKVILVDYANLMTKLEKVVESDSKIDQLFICDLGLSKKNEARFVELLARLLLPVQELTNLITSTLTRKSMS